MKLPSSGLAVLLGAALLLASCQSTQSQIDAALKPGSPELEDLYQSGRAAYLEEKYEEAAFIFARVVEVDPDHLNALINWGATLSRSGDLKGALEKYDQALARDPNNGATLYNKGVTLERLGKHAAAIEYYDMALTRDASLMTPALQRYLKRQRPKTQDTEIGGAPSSSSTQ